MRVDITQAAAASHAITYFREKKSNVSTRVLTVAIGIRRLIIEN